MTERANVFFFLLIAIAATPPLAAAQEQPDVAHGARIWAATCNRCHNARSPLERNDAEWGVIVNHMRTIANLTRSQARAVSAFLQASNGRSAGRETGAVRADSILHPQTSPSLSVDEPRAAYLTGGTLSDGFVEKVRVFLNSSENLKNDE